MSNNRQPSCLPHLVDAAEVAASAGASPQYIYAAAKRRQIPHYRFGYLVRFDPVEIAEWLKSHKAA
jgi:excisionase family DNA binding protein